MTDAFFNLRYEIGFGIKIGDNLVEWGTDRDSVRKMLQGSFEAVDHVYEGITSFRDFYSVLNGVQVLLSFNYSNSGALDEVEIHKGVRLFVENVFLEIGMSFFDAHDLVSQVSLVYKDVDVGEVIFLELGMCIVAGNLMGSEEDDFTLSYIYVARDISHLLV
jgi:hypothetical protein